MKITFEELIQFMSMLFQLIEIFTIIYFSSRNNKKK